MPDPAHIDYFGFPSMLMIDGARRAVDSRRRRGRRLMDSPAGIQSTTSFWYPFLFQLLRGLIVLIVANRYSFDGWDILPPCCYGTFI